MRFLLLLSLKPRVAGYWLEGESMERPGGKGRGALLEIDAAGTWVLLGGHPASRSLSPQGCVAQGCGVWQKPMLPFSALRASDRQTNKQDTGKPKLPGQGGRPPGVRNQVLSPHRAKIAH